MAFCLLHHPGRTPIAACLARHVDLAVLKGQGYDLARSLGDAHALWRASQRPGVLLELHCRTGHALTIEASPG